ncbi:unnamed protein product, partial [Musa textilis]
MVEARSRPCNRTSVRDKGSRRRSRPRKPMVEARSRPCNRTSVRDKGSRRRSRPRRPRVVVS